MASIQLRLEVGCRPRRIMARAPDNSGITSIVIPPVVNEARLALPFTGKYYWTRKMKRLHERKFPSSAEEGWPRDQEEDPKAPYPRGRGGVVQVPERNLLDLDQHAPRLRLKSDGLRPTFF